MHSELKARDSEADENSLKDDPIVLLPLEAMVKPLEIRFQYHFEGDRPTNRLDKVRVISKLVTLTRSLQV